MNEQVHDEIVFEVPINHVKTVSKSIVIFPLNQLFMLLLFMVVVIVVVVVVIVVVV